MSKPPAKYDRRLIGSWKSDRRRTFEHFKPNATASPKSIRKLKSMFGKLIVRYTRRRCHSEYDGTPLDPFHYEVVAADDESVVVRFWDTIFDREMLQQIHFEGDYYWIAKWGRVEWFRRVK